MKVKTAELSGRALDWAVALAVCPESFKHNVSSSGLPHWSNGWLTRGRPSSDWSQCGPLIEQFKLSIYLHSEYEINGEGIYDVYEAGCSTDWFVDATTPDPVSTDPKIAICRAVVASKLGDEVDIPDELMGTMK